MAKADLIKEAKKKGLEVDESMTVKEIQALIDSAPSDDSDQTPPDQNSEQDSQDKKTKKGAQYFVTTEFRDKANFNTVHGIGKDVSHFDAARLKELEALGYVEKR